MNDGGHVVPKNAAFLQSESQVVSGPENVTSFLATRLIQSSLEIRKQDNYPRWQNSCDWLMNNPGKSIITLKRLHLALPITHHFNLPI